MAYTLNFTCVQQADLSNILLTDTSSGGVDNNITTRRIYLYKLDSTTLVPAGTPTEYIDWPIVNPSGIGDTIEVDVLSRDYSLRAFVITTSTSPVVGAVYEKTKVVTFTGNTSAGAYQILQGVAARPQILQDQNYLMNLFLLNGEIVNAALAQANENQFAAQSALDRGYNMLVNQQIYF